MEQISALSQASRIAGFEGSAFHMLILLKEVRGRVDIFTRGEGLNANFDLIAEAKGFQQDVHYLPMAKVSGERSFSRYRVAEPASVARLLEG